MTKQIIVVPYCPDWPFEFEKIKSEICLALGETAITIEHVGSTSIVGLRAKPIIDIDVVIANYDVFDLAKRELERIGYRHEGDLGIQGREAFAYDHKPHLLTHHLYVCPQDSAELNRHRVFRDYLRAHPRVAQEYGRVKEEAAALYPMNIDRYLEHKGVFITEVYKKCGLL